MNEIKVINFNRDLHLGRLGFVEVLYNDLTLFCEVKYTKNEKHIWIKLPQNVNPKGIRFNSCHWQKKDDSDKFQKAVLEQLKSSYSEELVIPQNQQVRQFIKHKKQFKTVLKQAKPKSPFRNDYSIPTGKARGESRFKRV